MVQQTILRIQFHYQVNPFYFPDRSRLKRFILSVFTDEKRSVEHVNYIFCSDQELLKINRDYLKHDTYTDIISFSLSPEGEPILSDIYISIDRVRENASTFHSSFIRELHRVIFHGALHLCGYKDKNKNDQAVMRAREDHYLHRYFVPRGTK